MTSSDNVSNILNMWEPKNFQIFREFLIEWIVYKHISSSQVEDPFFRRFVVWEVNKESTDRELVESAGQCTDRLLPRTVPSPGERVIL
jgi:hypothetical protein